jgi:hypothetical protein
MAKSENEEQQYLATLDELEATQEEITSYQGLLKDIPEIYERKFNERLKPVLERRQELIEEREQLLRNLHPALPAEGRRALPPLQAPLSLPSPDRTEDQLTDRSQGIRRFLGLLSVVTVGIIAGWLFSKQGSIKPVTVTALPSPVAPSPDLNQDRPASTTTRSLRSRVVDQAIAEWTFFGSPLVRDGMLIRQGRDEGENGQWQRIRTYWQQGVLNESIRSRDDVTRSDNPWSAAFLSYIMKKAGAGDRFPYSANHATYIRQAIHHKRRPSPDAPFVGHRVSDYAPRPGDLICTTRDWARDKVTYDSIKDYEFFPSSCDLVIGSSDGEIDLIGGDRMGAVIRQKIKSSNGKLSPGDATQWLVVIETRFD